VSCARGSRRKRKQRLLTLSTVHSNGTDSVLTEMLSDFEDETATSVVLDFKSVQDSRKGVLFELNVDNSTNNGTVERYELVIG
jgi:hypothetical protein